MFLVQDQKLLTSCLASSCKLGTSTAWSAQRSVFTAWPTQAVVIAVLAEVPLVPACMSLAPAQYAHGVFTTAHS